MDFTLPTTKEQMYEVLNALFYHYKVKKDPYEEIILEEMQLERQEFVFKTQEELLSRAQVDLSAKHLQDVKEYQASLDTKISEFTIKVGLLESEKQKQTSDINSRYEQSLLKLEQTIQKNGLAGSGVALSQISYLENEKNKEIALVESKITAQIAEYQSQITALEEKRKDASTYFSDIHQKQIEKRVAELNDEQEEREREVFKYNNGLSEKELRYKNTLSQIKANMQARYIEMKVVDYSKDQLVEMGYYADVVKCITHYYDSLDKFVAYDDMIESERKLMLYLDDFYQELLYMYKLRAYGSQ